MRIGMKMLKLFDHLAPLVLSGEKTFTWRMFDDKDLRVGDDIRFIKTNSGEEFASARIVAIKEKKLSEISDADYVGHEKYGNIEELLISFRKAYGDRVTMDDFVKIIRFEVIEKLSS